MGSINCLRVVKQQFSLGRVQEGGTSLLLFGALTEQLVHDEPGKDESGLGRWSVMTLKGDGVQTRVVCGNNPCYNRKLESSTSYQQHRRYFITKRATLHAHEPNSGRTSWLS